MKPAPDNKLRFLPWLLAGFFLLTQAAALAHEYDHELHKHEVPCAQHFFAGSLKGGGAAPFPPALVAPVAAVFELPPASVLPSRFIAAYRGRAPPRAV